MTACPWRATSRSNALSAGIATTLRRAAPGRSMAALCGRGQLRGFLVRKEAKTHGTGNRIEGPLEPGSTVAIVDDVATTGGSSLEAVDAVLALGCQVALVIAVLDRLEGADAAFAARDIPFHPLLTIRDLGIS